MLDTQDDAKYTEVLYLTQSCLKTFKNDNKIVDDTKKGY